MSARAAENDARNRCPHRMVPDESNHPYWRSRCAICGLQARAPVTASDARPPSDTGATGWAADPSGNIHRWGRGCAGTPCRPILVLDPAEAREKAVEVLFGMGLEAPWIYVDAVLAALGGQEGEQP